MKMRRLAQHRVEPTTNNRFSICILHTLMLSLLFIVVMQGQLHAEGMINYPDRKALIVNNCPYVKLSNFWFENRYERLSYRFVQGMSWTNIGGKPIVAFEIVVLRYDAFNERINGTRWTITGINSENWTPLGPGYTESDTVLSLSTEEVFTGIAYVRAVRLRDGTIWRVDVKELLEQLRKVATDIEVFGDVNPEIKIKQN